MNVVVLGAVPRVDHIGSITLWGRGLYKVVLERNTLKN